MTNDESADDILTSNGVVINFVIRFRPKKYRPPRPMGVKGGCSPQNNRENFEATKRACGWSQQKFM